METSGRFSVTIELTARRIGLLGLTSITIILAGMVLTAIPYRGYGGEGYSPLNHFVSELGEIAESRLAWVFNIGIVLGGAGLGTFLLLVRRELDGRYGSALGMAAALAAISGTLVGLYPMDYHAIHRVSDAFFLSGLTVVATFSAWLRRNPEQSYPRWLAALGGVVVAVFLLFIAVYSTYRPEDPDATILVRSGVWSVPLLEWASLLGLLLWLACLASTLARRRVE